jgi:hypothetical protein
VGRHLRRARPREGSIAMYERAVRSPARQRLYRRNVEALRRRRARNSGVCPSVAAASAHRAAAERLQNGTGRVQRVGRVAPCAVGSNRRTPQHEHGRMVRDPARTRPRASEPTIRLVQVTVTTMQLPCRSVMPRCVVATSSSLATRRAVGGGGI